MSTSPWFVADFDSATGFLRALARALHGEPFRALGQPWWAEVIAEGVNRLPQPLARQVFAGGGLVEAVPPRKLRRIEGEAFSRWTDRIYPPGPFPVVAVGSASGALVHLCAALGIPWLPQTFLVPVRNVHGTPEDPYQDFAFGRQHGAALLNGNPDLGLHHMHDPNQDRLMVRWMSYFRVKRRTLGAVYEDFLRRRLEPGGTILVSDCTQSWPVTRLGPRHVFQLGAVGGASPQEYRERWQGPPADEEAAEAEWGFETALADDIDRFAAKHGFRVARLRFPEPDALSPLVADLYRWWYRRRGLRDDERLVTGSFILMDPELVLRTRSVPFWVVFNTKHDVKRLKGYLDRTAFDRIGLMLFPNGVRALGQPPLDPWRALLDRARCEGVFLGVDEQRFPTDFAALSRYHHALKAWAEPRPPPPRLTFDELCRFLEDANGTGGAVFSGLC